MLDYKSILVVIDPYHKEQPALSRALLLAKQYSAKITLCSSIYDNSYDMTTALDDEQKHSIKTALINQQINFLTSLVNKYLGKIESDCKVMWEKKTYKGIMKAAKDSDCELIVKSTKKHAKLGHKIFTPTDWHVIRNSPVNVLFVKEHEWITGGNVVCAVGVNEADQRHACLSKSVSETAYNINKTVEGNLHFINAYTGAPVHISIEVPQFSAELYNADVKRKRNHDIQPLATEFNVPDSNLHVEEGLPEDVIPDLCDELDAQLLVLGSVGRKGLSAALLGNTAEHIIDKINCDTLVVKP